MDITTRNSEHHSYAEIIMDITTRNSEHHSYLYMLNSPTVVRPFSLQKIFFVVFVILCNMSVSMCHVYIISSGRHGHDRI
jgi:hypothetical protein